MSKILLLVYLCLFLLVFPVGCCLMQVIAVIGCINTKCNVFIMNFSLKHYKLSFVIYSNAFGFNPTLSDIKIMTHVFFYLPDISFSILLFLTLLNLFVLGVSLVFCIVLDFALLANLKILFFQ